MESTPNQIRTSLTSLVLTVHHRGCWPRRSTIREVPHPVDLTCTLSRRLLFVSEISFLGSYEVDWEIDYGELKDEPIIRLSSSQIQILTKVSKGGEDRT